MYLCVGALLERVSARKVGKRFPLTRCFFFRALAKEIFAEKISFGGSGFFLQPLFSAFGKDAFFGALGKDVPKGPTFS